MIRSILTRQSLEALINTFILLLASIAAFSNPFPTEMTLNTTDGSTFILPVESELSLQSLLDSISQYENSEHEVQICMNFSGTKITANTTATVKGQKRNYWKPLTEQEKQDVAYILRTLANQTLIKINSSKSSLKKAGDRIEQIHPLRFLTYVFSNDELIVCMRNLQGRSWVWSEFFDGVVDSLKNEYALGNILDEHIQELAKQAKINASSLHPAIQSQNWGSLINTLISVVPRQGDANRYDM